jgi:hypothetical protein
MSNRTIHHRLLLLSVGLLGLAACSDVIDPLGPDPVTPITLPEQQVWSGHLLPGETIEIKGIIGDISAQATAGTAVVVSAVRRGDKHDPSEVTFEVVEHSRGTTVCAIYPDVPGKPANECGPGEQGSSTNHDSDVEVTFMVQVPAGVDFVGKTIAGSIRAEDLEGDVTARTIAGNAIVSTSGLAEASTIAGSVEASIGRADLDRDLEFTAVTGGVTVTVPSSTNAWVEASVALGNISSSFSLNHIFPGRVEGVLGHGGPTLKLSTVTGNIRLLRGP